MSPNGKHLFAGLALIFVGLELSACLGLSVGLSLTGVLSGIWNKPKRCDDSPEDDQVAPTPAVETQRAAPVLATPSESPAPARGPSAQLSTGTEPFEPAPPSVEPSAPAPTSAPPSSAPASEPSAPSLAAQDSTLLPHEVSFTFSNALACDSSADEGSSDGEGALGALGVVDEDGEGGSSGGSYSDGASGEELEGESSEYEDACELVFEPSSHGAPGLRITQRGISGLAERTEPSCAGSLGSPLLVASYSTRFVEVVQGRVKAAAEAEPAYVDQPLGVVAHSPRRSLTRPPNRSPSRSPTARGRGGALGPLASAGSLGTLSAGPSSSAL